MLVDWLSTTMWVLGGDRVTSTWVPPRGAAAVIVTVLNSRLRAPDGAW
jgi:hypothetical protein